MGFDISGHNPQSETGTNFRNSVWGWRPLWEFVCKTCDDVITEDDFNSGTFNDGHLIDKDKCEMIVERLTELLDNGDVKKYQDERQKILDELPLEKCIHCEGSGVRDDENVKGECNGCSGKGKVKNWSTSYPFDVDNVKEFRDFVKDSGGFEIW
tara:strand:+ start:402 stop:863 length:462 start_codon:yes stop_codon:yes gene_type:complete